MRKADCLKYAVKNKGGGGEKACERYNMKYIAALDGLRGITICMIAFLWHFWMFRPENGYPFRNIFVFSYSYGYLGVEIFFMISGFVMAYNYQDKIAKNEISFNSYFFKRVRHLWFINVLALLIVTIEHFIYYKYTGTIYVALNFDLWHFVLNFFLLQYGITDIQYSYNVPAWCLTIELMCYAIYFAVIRHDKNEEYWLKKCVGIILLGFAILSQGLKYPIINFEMARGIVSYFIGVILCEVFKKNGGSKYNIFLNVIMYIFLIGSYIAFRKFGISWMGSNVYFVILCFAPIIIWLTVNKTVVNKILSMKAMVFLGKLSLYIYLLHFPVQYFIKILDVAFRLQINYSVPLFLIVYSITTIFISIIAYMLSKRGEI